MGLEVETGCLERCDGLHGVLNKCADRLSDELPSWLAEDDLDPDSVPLQPFAHAIDRPPRTDSLQTDSGSEIPVQDEAIETPSEKPAMMTEVIAEAEALPENGTYNVHAEPDYSASPEVPDQIRTTLQELVFAGSLSTTEIQNHTRQLTSLVNGIPPSSAHEQIMYATTTLCSNSQLEACGFYRTSRMIDFWLSVVNSSIHRGTVYLDVLSHAAKVVRLSDVPHTFKPSTYEGITLALLKHWVLEQEVGYLSESQRDSTLQKIDEHERYATLKPSENLIATYEQLQTKVSSVPAGNRTALAPLFDLVVLLIKAEKPYRTCLEDILEFLLQADRPKDYYSFVHSLVTYYHIPIPQSPLKRWINANSAEHPKAVLRLYRLTKGLPLQHVPGLMTSLIQSPDIDPEAIHGLLTRAESRSRLRPAQRGNSQLCRLQQPIIDTVHGMILAFTTAGRFTGRARRTHLLRLYKWLYSRRAPMRSSVSRAIVLTFLVLPVFENKSITSSEAEFVIRAIRRTDGLRHEQSKYKQALHVARLHESYRLIHVRNWLEKEYGPGWRRIANPRDVVQTWESFEEEVEKPQ